MLILLAQAEGSQALANVTGLRDFDYPGFSAGHWDSNIKEAQWQ